MFMHRALCAFAMIALGCGGRYSGAAKAPATATPPAGGIEQAGLPFQVVDARTGRQVDEATFWPRLAQARAICVGEDHTNPHHHWVQLEVTRRLAKLVGPGNLALGLEMVQRPFQGVLDDYAAKRIDSVALRSRVSWQERWGYDWGFYAPTLDTAVASGAKLLALNAARELTKKVVRKGLEALTADEKAQVPELVLDDATHRAWFEALMESMGGAGAHSHAKKDADASEPSEDMPSAERIYTVQVIWDESMADGAAKWLAATPNGHAIILAGNGHCHDSAIVNRIKRRGITDVVSVRPVIDTEGQVGDALAKPVNDFLVVLQMPKGTTEGTAAHAAAP